jgi:hypothetical protein
MFYFFFYCWLFVRWLLSSDTDDVDDKFEWFDSVDHGCKFCKAFKDALAYINELLLFDIWWDGDVNFGLDDSERWWWEFVKTRRLAACRSCSRSSAVCRRHFVRRFWNHV